MSWSLRTPLRRLGTLGIAASSKITPAHPVASLERQGLLPCRPGIQFSSWKACRTFRTTSQVTFPRQKDHTHVDKATSPIRNDSIDEDPHSHAYWHRQHIQPPSIGRAVGFFLAFGAFSFGAAAYTSLRDTQQVAEEVKAAQGPFGNLSSFFSRGSTGDDSRGEDTWGPGITEKKLLIAKRHETAERLGVRMEWLMGWCDQLGLPEALKEAVGRGYIIVAENYIELPTSKQVLVPIIAFNALVFAAWRLSPAHGRLEHFLSRSFLHRPASGRLYTMLTSTFSHRGGLHFLFNNYALWSIGGSSLIYASHVHAGRPGIPEASRTPHFLAFFATAGVFAATVSHIVTAIRFRRLSTLRGLEHVRHTIGRQSSLGASGAVYSALVMSACAFPDAQVSLIFLPMFALPIGTGVQCIVLVDLIGALRGWPMFDHWAHLGGALFGYIYFHYGPQVWEAAKAIMLQQLDLPGQTSTTH